MPLNPELYKALVNRFGEVHISSEGVPWVGKSVQKRGADQKIQNQVEDVQRGEQYNVTCPNCHKPKKFTVSHINGTAPPPYTEVVWHKASCWSCGYGRKYGSRFIIKELLGGYAKLSKNRRVKLAPAKIEAKPLEPTGKLGYMFPETMAYQHLKGRGFDPQEIHDKYNVRRIVEPVHKDRAFLKERIVIPMYHEGNLVSWQARIVFPGQKGPKWYIAKNSRKCAYNLDTARKLPYIVLQEACFDAWVCGDHGVAVFGKYLSALQMESLVGYKGHIIVSLDPDAAQDAKELTDNLRMKVGRRATQLIYPNDWPTEYDEDKGRDVLMDPAAVGPEKMDELIQAHIKAHKIET